MKFASVLAIAAALCVVSAETNSHRMSRGLAPKNPTKRMNAERSTPSSSPGGGSCNTGSMQCCQSSGVAGEDDDVDQLLALLDLVVDVGTSVGMSCSGLSFLGSEGCQASTFCCTDNDQSGLVNIGCVKMGA